MPREKVRMRKVNSNGSYTASAVTVHNQLHPCLFGPISKDHFILAISPQKSVFGWLWKTNVHRELKKMKPLKSSKSHRLFDFVPSVKPSVVSVILVFVCGVLWVKNETTNEQLIALESRLHCFSCVKSVSTEDLDKMTPPPTKDSAKYHHKNIRTPISEGIGHTYSVGV